jgi:hypothetical protein
MFGNYSVDHTSVNFYGNRLPSFVALNFPYYTLERRRNGSAWAGGMVNASWGPVYFACAAELNQAANTAVGNAEMYISD